MTRQRASHKTACSSHDRTASHMTGQLVTWQGSRNGCCNEIQTLQHHCQASYMQFSCENLCWAEETQIIKLGSITCNDANKIYVLKLACILYHFDYRDNLSEIHMCTVEAALNMLICIQFITCSYMYKHELRTIVAATHRISTRKLLCQFKPYTSSAVNVV